MKWFKIKVLNGFQHRNLVLRFFHDSSGIGYFLRAGLEDFREFGPGVFEVPAGLIWADGPILVRWM